MHIEKLMEFNQCELVSQDNWKYIIKTYANWTSVGYFEENSEGKIIEKERFSIPSCCDIQVCEKIIELRKSFKK